MAELRSYGDHDLATFLDESGLELSDILRRGSHSWTRLRRDAGLQPAGSELEEQLSQAVRAFAHVDDRARAGSYARLLRDDAPAYDDLSPASNGLPDVALLALARRRWIHVLSTRSRCLAPGGGDPRRARAASSTSPSTPPHVTLDLVDALLDVPLKVHARYQREEILAALGLPEEPQQLARGRLVLAEKNIDVFFITLKKSETDYSPTTMYHDYPISPTLFHWESQSTTSLASDTGQRYIYGTSTVLLFAREEPKDESGTSAYLFLGEVATSNMKAIAPSPSRGSCRTRCRATSSRPRPWQPVDE